MPSDPTFPSAASALCPVAFFPGESGHSPAELLVAGGIVGPGRALDAEHRVVELSVANRHRIGGYRAEPLANRPRVLIGAKIDDQPAVFVLLSLEQLEDFLPLEDAAGVF